MLYIGWCHSGPKHRCHGQTRARETERQDRRTDGRTDGQTDNLEKKELEKHVEEFCERNERRLSREKRGQSAKRPETSTLPLSAPLWLTTACRQSESLRGREGN